MAATNAAAAAMVGLQGSAALVGSLHSTYVFGNAMSFVQTYLSLLVVGILGVKHTQTLADNVRPFHADRLGIFGPFFRH